LNPLFIFIKVIDDDNDADWVEDNAEDSPASNVTKEKPRTVGFILFFYSTWPNVSD
jgi:hypothetical protein